MKPAGDNVLVEGKWDDPTRPGSIRYSLWRRGESLEHLGGGPLRLNLNRLSAPL